MGIRPFRRDRWTLLAVVCVLALGVSVEARKAKSQAVDVEGADGSQRAIFWRLLSLYGSGEPASTAEANKLLDSILPRNQTAPVDPEDKFAHAAAVDLYRMYGAKLPEVLRERARWDLASRVKAVERTYYPQRRTNFSMGHTNFALMYLEAFLLGSEALGDPVQEREAYQAFDEFCDYTLHNGFTEFNATDYGKIDLHCLGDLATASVEPRIRRRAGAFAEWLWLEMALHYWPSGGWLTGANARTYNYVVGYGGAVGSVRPFFMTPGDARERPAGGGEGGWLATTAYRPPAYLAEIARQKQTTVYRGLWLAPEPDAFRKGFEGEAFDRNAHGEFGHQYGKDRYTFIEPAYALGTGGAHYSTQDRMLVADIASRKALASISAQINTSLPLDDWQEFLSFLGDNRHAQTGSAAVQDRNLAMILYSVTPNPEAKRGVPIVAPLLLLPANVDAIRVNGKPADARPGVHPLAAGDVLYLREGEVYASLRFVPSEAGFAGYPPTYHYRLDGNYEMPRQDRQGMPGPFRVGALSCVLYSGPVRKLAEKNVRAGFVVEMATAKEFATLDEFVRHIERGTTIQQSFRAGVWEVRYRSGKRELSLRKDMARDLVLDKRVDGVRVENPAHATNFSELRDGLLTVRWKGVTHSIDLRR